MVPASANPYSGKPLATPLTSSLFEKLAPASQKYVRAKLGYDLGNQERLYGSDSAMWNINHLLKTKGGQQVSDWSQVDSALQPLIAKRNERGWKKVLGPVLTVASVIPSPIQPYAMAANAAYSASQGDWVSAALNAAGAAGKFSTAGKVLAKSGPLAGNYVTPGANLTRAVSGPMAGSLVRPSMGANIGTNVAGFNPNMIDRAASFVGRTVDDLKNFGQDTLQSVGGAIGLGGETTQGLADAIGLGSTGGSGMMNGSNPLATALGGFMDYRTQSELEKSDRLAQQQAMNEFSPYRQSGLDANRMLSEALAAGFDPSNLANDPGYQFRLAEGRKGLERSLAARGMGQSGAALKAAQEYGQNFAAQEFSDAYERWLANNRQLANQANVGFNSATNTANAYSNLGEIRSRTIADKNNIIRQTLTDLLGGSGGNNNFGSLTRALFG